MSKKNKKLQAEFSDSDNRSVEIEDTSPRIEQRGKFKSELQIKEFPWTDNQKKIIDALLSKESRIVIINGPAGSGKSLIGAYCGLKLLQSKKLSDILYVRNPLEAGESSGFGFLAGDLFTGKYLPYMNIINEKLTELLPPSDVNKLNADKRIVPTPLNFIRGSSWAVKYIWAEEVNNFTLNEFLLLMSRYASFSKLVLIGDSAQSDLPQSKRGFEKVYEAFNTEKSKQLGIHCFTLEKSDVKRSEISAYILDQFDGIKKPKDRIEARF